MIRGVVLQEKPLLCRPSSKSVRLHESSESISEKSRIHCAIIKPAASNALCREAAPKANCLWKKITLNHVLRKERCIFWALDPYLTIAIQNDVGLVAEENSVPFGFIPFAVVTSESKSLIDVFLCEG